MTDQAGEVVAIVRQLLGDDVLGAYLHGSAVLGGLRPTSDCDVLVVVRRPTSAEERGAIIRGLFEISGERARRAPARPVELTVVVQSDVRPWRYPPRLDLQYGEWLRSEMEAGAIADPHPAPDLALLVTMVLAGGRPLLGPPPAELLDPVPPDDLRRAAVAGVPRLLEDLGGDTRNVLLTLARIWVTLATGAIVAKDAASDWALERLPADLRPALADARDSYREGHHGEWEGRIPEARATAAAMVAAIERLAPRDG